MKSTLSPLRPPVQRSALQEQTEGTEVGSQLFMTPAMTRFIQALKQPEPGSKV